MACLFSYIYTLSHPLTGEVKYVGKTDDLKARLKHHIKLGKDKNSCKGLWIGSLKKVGLVPTMEIIETVEQCAWQFWEVYYISLFKSWGFSLVNSTIGGESNNGHKHSESTKEKLRIINTGKKASEETKAKMRLTNVKYWGGKKRSDEDIEKFSKSHKGVPFSEERREKMAGRITGVKHHFFGKKLSAEHIAKLWANRTHEVSDEAKMNVSIGLKKWWAKRKEGKC